MIAPPLIELKSGTVTSRKNFASLVHGTDVAVGGSGVEGMRVKPGSTVRATVGGDAATVNVAVGKGRAMAVGVRVGVTVAHEASKQVRKINVWRIINHE
jgi:hypothetical protein